MEPAGDLPSVSVVIRSYKRHASLLKLLDALRQQDHSDYEVVVMEQSDFTPEERAPLDALAAADPRFRFIYSRPLGVGGARDAGWRQARKDIVLTIDDDDLALGIQFVSTHAKNYLDPTIVAVTGRHVYSEDERCGYGRRGQAKRRCLSYNFFGYPHAYCRLDERIESVQWVHGTNGSVRKSVIERVGGWDPLSTNHDEHPFCLALLNKLRPGERLVFDPTAVLLRRKDIPGGASVRFDGAERTFRTWFRYYHGLVHRHRRTRFWALYPVFPLAVPFSAIRWIWTDSMAHRGVGARLLDSVKTLLRSPFWYAQELVRWRRGEPQH